MTTDPFWRIRQAAQADLPRQRRELRRELRVARREHRKHRWRRWRDFWKRRADDLKIAGMVIGGAAGVVTGGAALYKNAHAMWHAAKRAWSFYADRDVGEPAQPPPTGAPSTALDFPVTRGRPPDGGQR